MGLYQDVLESADGGAFVNLRDSVGTGITSTAVSAKQALDVFIQGGATTGAIADKTTFTYGTTSQTPIGGVFQDTSPTLTAGQSGAVRLTSNRAFHINLRDASGNELGAAASGGVFVKPTDGTNSQAFASSGEAFTTIRQAGNIATVNGSGQLATADANSAAILAFMKSATGTITSPTLTSASSTLLASNANRKGFSFVNSTIYPMFVAFAATASSTAFTVKVNANSFYEHLNTHIYTGVVTMITPTVVGTPTVPVTEYT